MLEMLLGIFVLIAVAVATVWVADQISEYMQYENMQEIDDFEFEPLFK